MRISRNSRQTRPFGLPRSQNSVFSIRILRICWPICNDRSLSDKFRSCPQSVGDFFFVCGLRRSHIVLRSSSERSDKCSGGEEFEHTFLLLRVNIAGRRAFKSSFERYVQSCRELLNDGLFCSYATRPDSH